MNTELPSVVIYTDGGCRPNPGPGGWGAVLVIVGFAIANLTGIGAAWFNTVHPLDFSGYGDEVYKMYGMDPRIYANLEPMLVVWPNLMVLSIVVLALVYPAWRASRIRPAEAVRRRK